ncbi:MAG: hypothetical protein J5594_05380 [Elusimicrobiaceae bacterium]|nr:hypothetical protein [Elusimicrobiaceae bacterium]
MKKYFATFAILAMCVGFVYAAAPKTNAAKTKSTVKEIPVTVIVMDDDATGGVDSALNSGLERTFDAKLNVTTINRSAALNDPKYQGLNLDFMPLYLIEKNDVVKTKIEEFIKNGQLRPGQIPEHNGQLVFEHQTRNGVYANKALRPNELDLFVMSQCPYGVRAENQIIDLLKLDRLPKDLKINVRYIASERNGEINSLHGSAEWEEDVRQIIIREKYPKKFWKYLEIRNKDYRSSLWDVAAEEAGINPRIFRKYWKFGLEKLKEDMKITEEYNVSGSPTVIWQGRTVTDLGSLGNIRGLEGFKQNYSGSAANAAPQGQC